VANLSEGNSLFRVLARWKTREAGSQMKVSFQDPNLASDEITLTMLCNGKGTQGVTREGAARFQWAQCSYVDLAHSAPTFVIASYGVVDRPSNAVFNFSGHAVAAEAYADETERVVPLIAGWFGNPRVKPQTADLLDASAARFESGALLLTPLANSAAKLTGLTAAHQLTHASVVSFRPWIEEGLAHFAQALYLENQKGRQAALDYMGAHRSALTAPDSEDEAKQSLVDTSNEQLYRSKAMCVWWMLRDTIGDAALKKAIASYKPEQDNDPTYMPRLIAAQTQRDLQWLFDDWVYHDRGLPDFKVESAFAASTPTKSFLLTITLDNLGTAGAEVPVTIKFAGGEVSKRIEVRGKSKATFRVETPAAPQEIRVNDGSVPESDMTNNTFKVGPAQN
jgi:hypothetical protein